MAPLREGRPLPARLVYCDTGGEVSAYGSDRFLRAIGVGGVWRGAPPDPLWFAYEWKDPGRLSRVEEDGALRGEVRAYFERAVPMRFGAAPSAEQIERMRALGYGE